MIATQRWFGLEPNHPEKRNRLENDEQAERFAELAVPVDVLAARQEVCELFAASGSEHRGYCSNDREDSEDGTGSVVRRTKGNDEGRDRQHRNSDDGEMNQQRMSGKPKDHGGSVVGCPSSS